MLCLVFVDFSRANDIRWMWMNKNCTQISIVILYLKMWTRFDSINDNLNQFKAVPLDDAHPNRGIWGGGRSKQRGR